MKLQSVGRLRLASKSPHDHVLPASGEEPMAAVQLATWAVVWPDDGSMTRFTQAYTVYVLHVSMSGQLSEKSWGEHASFRSHQALA